MFQRCHFFLFYPKNMKQVNLNKCVSVRDLVQYNVSQNKVHAYKIEIDPFLCFDGRFFLFVTPCYTRQVDTWKIANLHTI